MKDQRFLLVILLFALTLQGFRVDPCYDRSNATEPVSSRLSIVYVEGSSPGLSIKVRNHLENTIDSIAENPFLLYVSNSMADESRKSDYYTKSRTSIQKRLSKLDDETLPNPDLRGDKSFIWEVIANENFSEFSEVDLHYYFTDSFLQEYILKETSACYFLNFLPAEISTFASKAIVNVNIYVSDSDPNKLAELKSALKQKVMFKNEGMFELTNLRCNIVEL